MINRRPRRLILSGAYTFVRSCLFPTRLGRWQPPRSGGLSPGPAVPSTAQDWPSLFLGGALQIPSSGTPVLFLADHPVTGGYPVVGYVVDRDVDRCGQLRTGQTLRFTTRQLGP